MRTTKTIFKDMHFSSEESLIEYIQDLRDVLDDIPEEYRHTACVCFETEYDSDEIQSSYHYEVPLTEEELAEAGQKKLQRDIENKKRKFQQLNALKKELGIEE